MASASTRSGSAMVRIGPPLMTIAFARRRLEPAPVSL
jgi:hypothetical protein